MAVDEEPGWFYIELFGHVLADFNQLAATLIALTGLWLMPMFNAWQMIRQRLAARASAR